MLSSSREKDLLTAVGNLVEHRGIGSMPFGRTRFGHAIAVGLMWRPAPKSKLRYEPATQSPRSSHAAQRSSRFATSWSAVSNEKPSPDKVTQYSVLGCLILRGCILQSELVLRAGRAPNFNPMTLHVVETRLPRAGFLVPTARIDERNRCFFKTFSKRHVLNDPFKITAGRRY